LLRSSILSPSSDVNVVSTVAFSNSLHWKSGSEVEWSVDVESEVLMKSLGLNCFSFVKIDDLPFLILSIMSIPDYDLSSFFISI
jgi:hypothetical protein